MHDIKSVHWFNFLQTADAMTKFSSHLSSPRHEKPIPVLLPRKSHGQRSLVGCSPWDRSELGMTERLHFHLHFHALEKEMATHSSVLAWSIPGTGEPRGLTSMGSHRVGHDWSDLAAAAAPGMKKRKYHQQKIASWINRKVGKFFFNINDLLLCIFVLNFSLSIS